MTWDCSKKTRNAVENQKQPLHRFILPSLPSNTITFDILQENSPQSYQHSHLALLRTVKLLVILLSVWKDALALSQ